MVLPGARVVGEEEAQRLTRKHRLVDAGDLVRQRVDHRGVDRQQRVEQVREADALGLGHQPEQRPVAVPSPNRSGAHRNVAEASGRQRRVVVPRS